MKIRLLLVTLISAVALSLGAHAAEAETELGGKMEKIGGAFRALRRQINDSAKNADSLAKVATIRENAQASLKLEPAMKAEIPAAQQQKFVADYQAKMKEFIDLTNQIEAALKANKNDEAAKLLTALNDAQKQGHNSFKKKDEKKKT